MISAIKRVFDKRLFKIIMILIPFALGTAGYYAYYSVTEKALTLNLFSSLYSSIRLFGFSYDASGCGANNWYYWFIEIARYWAGSITGSALFTIIRPFLHDMYVKSVASKSNSMALHCSRSICTVLKDDLKDFSVIDNSDSSEISKRKTTS